MDSRGVSTNPRGKPRVVYHYRKLNAVSQLLPPLLPRILDVVRRVAGSRFFSKMDLRAGFHNLRMHPDSVESTAFCFPGLGVSRYMAGRERIVDEVSCFVDIEESCIDS